MAKNAEANLLLKIKQTGKEAITSVSKALDDVKIQAGIATAAIAGFIGFTVKKYGEQEQAEKALTQSLKAQGLEVDSLFKKYTELASAIQSKTTQDDTAIIKGIALAQSFAGQLTLTEDLIKATIDFAAAQGMDLSSAFTAVGKTIGTNTNALARYGVEVSSNLTSSQKMEAVVAKLDRTWGGWAESQRKGLGQLKALGENIDDMTETIGKHFAPAVSEAAEAMNDLIADLSNEQLNTIAKWTAGILAAAGAVTGLVAGLGALGAALPAISAGFGIIAALLTGPVGIAVGVTAVAAGLATWSGALDGIIEKSKKALGFGGPEQREDGNYVDEREAYMKRRAEAEMSQLTKTTDHAIAEEKRARDERSRIANQLADDKKKAEENYLKELRSAQGEYETWLENRKNERVQNAASNPASVLTDSQTMNAGSLGQAVDGRTIEFAAATIGVLTIAGEGKAGAEKFFQDIYGAIGGVLGPGFENLFRGYAQMIQMDADELTEMIKEFMIALPEVFVGMSKGMPAIIKGILEAFKEPEFWKGMVEAVIYGIMGIGISIWQEIFRAMGRQWGIEGDELLQKIKNFFSEAWTNIGNFFKTAFSSIGSLFEGLGAVFTNAFDTIRARLSELLGGFTSAFSGLKSGFTDLLNDIKSAISNPLDSIKSAFDKFTDAIKGIIPGGGGGGGGVGGVVGKIGKALGFSEGGLVPNVVSSGIQRFAAGGTVDTVPAMLQPGEMVINKDATQKNLGLLQSINSGSGSAGGGLTINMTINGGLLGDESTARQLARAIDEQLLKLRQSNQSVAFEKGLF